MKQLSLTFPATIAIATGLISCQILRFLYLFAEYYV